MTVRFSGPGRGHCAVALWQTSPVKDRPQLIDIIAAREVQHVPVTAPAVRSFEVNAHRLSGAWLAARDGRRRRWTP